MKKFILTANLIAMLFLVPAVIVGYLQSNAPVTEKSASKETAKDVTNGQEEAISINLVKSF
ncbi:MAG: hypothetical protein KGO92_05485 [Bacteroidota bacterium]|nr:hypothetical protein [Bacteroidota bacterium]